MAVGRHGEHIPVAVEGGGSCERNGTEDGECGRKSEGAQTISNHWGSSYLCLLHGMELSWRLVPLDAKSTGNFPRKRYRIIAKIGAPRQAGSRLADRTNQRIGAWERR